MILANNKEFRRCVKAAVAAVVFTALTVICLVPAMAAAQPAASEAAASARDDIAVSRKNKNDVGIRGHGFVRNGDVFTTIDVPGATTTLIIGANDRGQMVGVYADADGIQHGFLLDDSVVTVIDVPNAAATTAWGINNRGQIVGFYTDAEGLYGFLLNNSVFTTITVPGAFQRSVAAYDIDDHGRIVGTYF